MVKYEVRDATLEDVEYLAPRLRKIDKREIYAVSGGSARRAILSGFKLSEHCKVGTADGVPVCIFGIRRPSLLSDNGVIWLLGTEDVEKHAMKFGRGSKDELKLMKGGFKLLENFCHAENKKTIRWLKWLGFKVEKPEPFGCKKELFHRFYMRVN